MVDTQERGIDDAERDMQRTADDLQEHGARVGEQIDKTRQGWERTKADDFVPTGSADWEDEDADHEDDEDPTGFDDPESLDLDEDEDEHADE